ncbi:arylsulfatase [Paucibacter sp. R3-3]|uniref:Arylsulfatase n=1 Tax=Roseateles agri TaxID=3098619 RepID=A0ABU5DIK1_9BURK|nr:arylsulfatase [Paucibacter sp. R3-3]MDY0744927.1 arylsulfatase [Paucibacter sp. R3-3]
MKLAPALLALPALLLALGAGAADEAAAPRRPNIVFVLLDDAGFSDFGAYGSEIATPNIDAIAQQGVRFTNFHTASTCESSRTMLQSGVDHHRGGAGTLQVVIADNQRGQPGYEGYLSDRVHSLGQLLHDAGYATYYSGKWNLGQGAERAPGARGWERYFALENTGADNYEARVYAPFNREAVWWEDGKKAALPPDFYSSHDYVSKLVQYVDEGRKKADKRPFMAMLAFQAVHSPLQVPARYTDKYLKRYDEGWAAVREERYQRQVKMGLVPAGLTMPANDGARDWNKLSPDERRTQAKKMAVFAGMLEAADEELGRLRQHLKDIGELDNTVFIVMSDNGADAYDLSQLNLPFRIWYRANNALGYEQMGLKGSYVHYGQDWAEVSNTPLRLFKGTSAEGGMRVPFIVQMPANSPGSAQPGRITDQFAYATDFLPTVLDIAGVPRPPASDKLFPLTGKSLLPLIEGAASAPVHDATEAIGFEGTGGQALFQGGYKLMRNGTVDGNRWQLYDTAKDWTETNDLAAQQPERVQKMLAEVLRYNKTNGVILPGPGYNPLVQLLKNNAGVLVSQLGGIVAALLLIVLGVPALLLTWWLRRRR